MSSLHRGSKNKRRRKPQTFFQNSQASAAEERFLQQAIQNSKLDQRRPADGKLDIPMGPTFFPTVEEMEGSPLAFIEKIRPVAQNYGVCKIVPPAGWKPPFCIDMNSTKRFQTKEQQLHRLQEGIHFGDGVEYTSREYQHVASERAKAWKMERYPDHDLMSAHAIPESDNSDAASKVMSPENLERDYWDIVETRSRDLTVEYGNDIDTTVFGSGFPLSERGRSLAGKTIPEKVDAPEPKFGQQEYYRETWWNLNNIPCAPDSVLRHVKAAINGINVPWLYHGSLFSTFCWHNEDNYLYSINYHHKGAPKLWYGVPGSKKDADGLEKVFKSYLSMKMRDVPDLLHHITTMFSPRLLQTNEVSVHKLIQYPGEFVVTFPRSFHGGFSLGPNVGEAVNFANHDWIAFGSDANERYRCYARPAVFSHDRLTFTMANHLKEQKAYRTCKLLLEELERVVKEELVLRGRLLKSGVRDVTGLLPLPKNVLDKLDDESAEYDDKRLCHSCKHVCFFSAVACDCSFTKVSCLRHSHFMCRCPQERKYLMVWSTEEEMQQFLTRVQDFCQALKEKAGSSGDADDADETKPSVPVDETDKNATAVTAAPGSLQDKELHKNAPLSLEPVGADPNYKQIRGDDGRPRIQIKRQKLCMGASSPAKEGSDDLLGAALVAPMPPSSSDQQQSQGGDS